MSAADGINIIILVSVVDGLSSLDNSEGVVGDSTKNAEVDVELSEEAAPMAMKRALDDIFMSETSEIQ